MTRPEEKRLTARKVQQAKPPKQGETTLNDPQVAGLHMRITKNGVKTWGLLYRVNGKRRRVKLGRYPTLGLKDARQKAQATLRDVELGGDPAKEKRLAREADADTFGALADRYIEQHAKPRKKTWKQDRRMLDRDVPKSWRTRDVKEITRADIRKLIEHKAETAPIAANRVRALLSKVFNFALQRDLVEFNPVTGTPRPGVEKQRQRVLTEDEIRTFWKATEPADVDDIMRPAMSALWRLRLVTAQRLTEIADMEWPELDLDNAVWTIPPERSKNGLAHRVTLSKMAVEIITVLPQHDSHVLAGARGNRQRYQAAALIAIEDFKGHDLRRTAASCMASAGVPRLHIAKVLNHKDTGVTSVYDRHSYDAEKKAALDLWAAKLTAIIKGSKGADVIAIASAK